MSHCRNRFIHIDLPQKPHPRFLFRLGVPPLLSCLTQLCGTPLLLVHADSTEQVKSGQGLEPSYRGNIASPLAIVAGGSQIQAIPRIPSPWNIYLSIYLSISLSLSLSLSGASIHAGNRGQRG